jgi:hypothetical protein
MKETKQEARKLERLRQTTVRKDSESTLELR